MFFDIWQRDLEIAQMRSNLEELKEKLNKERNINLKKVCIIKTHTHTHTHTHIHTHLQKKHLRTSFKHLICSQCDKDTPLQDAEIMALKEEAAGQAESGLAAKDLLESRESEVRLLKLLQCSRDALDRNTIRSMGFGFDPKEMENVPVTLVNLPQEITKLYRVLDEYSKRLEQFQNLFPSETAVNEALSSLKELHDTKKDNAQLLAANKKLMQMVDKYKEELAVEKEKVKSLQERAIAIEKSLKSLQDLPVLSSPPVDATVNGVPIEEVSAIEKDSALTKALEKICRRIVTSHDTIVYDIIGAGPSKFSRSKLQSRLDEANDPSKADKLVEDVCKVVEEYIKQYWTLLRSQTGVKDLAETIHLVKKQSDSEVAEEREHVGELKKLKGMLREARIRPEGQSWVDDILERWTWTQKKWEKRKREIIEARAEAILKCAESVLHVVTLNTGIKLSTHDKQDIIRSLQVSCVGRGNAFWPPQHVFDETSEKNPSSFPSHRAHTAIEKSSQPLFSISRLPLHRVPHDEGSLRSRGRDEGSFKSNMQTEKDCDKALWRKESEHNTLTPPLNAHAREHSLSPRNTGNIESWRPPSSPVQGMYPIYGQEHMSPDEITMTDGDIQKSHSTSVRTLGIWPSTMISNARLEIGDYISHGDGGTRSTKQGYHLQGMQSYTDSHRPGLSPTLRQWSQSPRARNVAEARIPTAPAILPDTVTGRAQRQERDWNRASKLPVLAKAKLQSSAEFYEQLTDTLECKGLDYSQTEADPSCRTPKPWTPSTPAPEHINTSKPSGHQKSGDIRHHFEIHDMRERDTSSHLSSSRGSPRTADIMTGAGTTAPGKSPCDSPILRRTPVPPPGPRGAQTAR
jgi:flagellar biosynthesis chaperone FliJ